MSKETIQNLEALLRRVQKNAAEPRAARAFAAPAAAASAAPPSAMAASLAPRTVTAPAPAAAAPAAAAPAAAAPAAKPRAATSAEDPANWSMQDLALDEPRPAAAAPEAVRAEARHEPLRFAGKSFEVPAARAKLADTPPVRGFGAMKPAQAPRFGKTQLGLEDQAAKVLQETLKTPAPKPSDPGARAGEPVIVRRASPVENRAFHEAATAEVPKLDLPPVPPADEPAPPRTFGWRDELPTHEAIAALPIVNVSGAGPEEAHPAAAPAPSPAPAAASAPMAVASEPPIAIEPSVTEQLPVEPAAPRADEPDARRFAEPDRMPPQPEPDVEPAATARVAQPEKPAFSDGAADAPSKFATTEVEAPTKKKSSLLLVIALIAIVVGAGVFAYNRFFRTTGGPTKKTPAVLPTSEPTTETTTAPTSTATAEAFPTASGDPAAPTGSASAAPPGSAAADDLPALPGDPKQLPVTLGYLLIKAPEGKVFLNGQNAGDVNTWLKISCNGTKFLRLGKATGGWIDEGRSIALKCRESTVIPTP